MHACSPEFTEYLTQPAVLNPANLLKFSVSLELTTGCLLLTLPVAVVWYIK